MHLHHQPRLVRDEAVGATGPKRELAFFATNKAVVCARGPGKYLSTCETLDGSRGRHRGASRRWDKFGLTHVVCLFIYGLDNVERTSSERKVFPL